MSRRSAESLICDASSPPDPLLLLSSSPSSITDVSTLWTRGISEGAAFLVLIAFLDTPEVLLPSSISVLARSCTPGWQCCRIKKQTHLELPCSWSLIRTHRIPQTQDALECI